MEAKLIKAPARYAQEPNCWYKEIYELFKVVTSYEIWLYIAYNDLKSRYRRTILGPFWLVLANGIMLAGMGIVWSVIFKFDLSEYFPKLVTSMLGWLYISNSINEAGSTFNQYYNVIQNLNISIYLHPLRSVSRNVIAFFHNLVIYFIVILIFKVPINIEMLLFIPMMSLVIINMFSITYIFGLIGSRVRDFPQALSAAMSVMIFVTPVLWDIEMLGRYKVIAYVNPLTHFINVLKMPLLGQLPSMISVLVIAVGAVLSFFLMIFLSRKYSDRIAYWI